MYIFLLISISLLLSGCNGEQSSTLYVQTSGDANELHHQPADGKQLYFFDLSETTLLHPEGFTPITLSGESSLYRFVIDGKSFTAYSAPGAIDTVVVTTDSLLFYGENRLYNQFLQKMEEADRYCQRFSRSRNHELNEINNPVEFDNRIDALKRLDNGLLSSYPFDNAFYSEQQLMTELRYDALFLKKVISLYNRGALTDEWMEALKNKTFDFSDPRMRQSIWFQEIIKDYACVRAFILQQINPQEVMDSFNSLLFDSYCEIPETGNREYALAYLLYDDGYQEEYNKEIPPLYDRFVSLYPQSPYLDILAPRIEKVRALYVQDTDNEKIHFAEYSEQPQNFEQLIRPFAGKVVYIDIWSTTCAPCVKSFEQLARLKEQTKGMDEVVFLYISLDHDRYAEKWQQMIYFYQLEGYHYRVNRQTSPIIYETFGDANGMLMIPHYAIIDQQGKIAFPQAAASDDADAVVTQLNTLLK